MKNISLTKVAKEVHLKYQARDEVSNGTNTELLNSITRLNRQSKRKQDDEEAINASQISKTERVTRVDGSIEEDKRVDARENVVSPVDAAAVMAEYTHGRNPYVNLLDSDLKMLES